MLETQQREVQTAAPVSVRGRGEWDELAPGVSGLRIALVNVFAVRDAGSGWVLVDTGLYFSAGKIRRWVEGLFGGGARPAAIVLTHGHFDHVGSLRPLVEYWNVAVYAHPLELPYLTGRSSYPPPDPSVGRGAMSLFAPVYPRGPVNLGSRVQPLPDDGSVPGLNGWRWIHTPGHTPGHISLFHDADRTLIAGDAFVTTKQESLLSVMTQRREFHGPPAYYTSDWDAARQSVEQLAELRPQVVVCGHGLPISGPEASAGLERLARNFSREIPSQGRYVGRPAVSDESGVVEVPPAVGYPYTRTLAVAAMVGGAWWMYCRRRRGKDQMA